MPNQLQPNLQENLAALQAMFGDSGDFYAKPITIEQVSAAIVMFDNLAGLQSLWDIALDRISHPRPELRQQARLGGPALYTYLMEQTDIPASPKPVTTLDEAVTMTTAGFALLLLDGVDKALAFSVQNMKFRSVSSPSAEGNMRGSREGFCDMLRVNISLLRRMVRTESFVAETIQSETSLKTEYALCYDRAVADPHRVKALKQRLAAARPPVLLDSSYFVPWLHIRGIRMFSPVGYTERPVVAAAKLREGKILVMVNGSPSAMIVPYLFLENFSCLDDYAGPAYFAALLRLLKLFSFILTITLPGLFVTAAAYTPEWIPPELLYKIAAAEQGTPLPLFAEMLVVILVLEIIREAGLRMPDSLGNSVSLVAALIVGDAAISAGVLSTYVILVAAVTSIAMFVTPALYEPASVLRLLFLVAGGLAGPVGLAAATLFALLALSTPEILDVPYLSMLLPAKSSLWVDGLIRKKLPDLAEDVDNSRPGKEEKI